MHELKDSLRNITPLALRRYLGPWLGYGTYWWRTRVRGRTWEPEVLSIEDTLDTIKKECLSAIRFGDGELSLIENQNLGFQEADDDLARRLREVLQAADPGLLICIPGIWGALEHLTARGFWFEIHHLFRYGSVWKSLLSRERVYGDSFFARPYLSYKDKSTAAVRFAKARALWEETDVVLIEGAQSRLGVGNDLFANVRSMQRILCPAENAYRAYEAIRAEALKQGKDKLILCSLGPAAKALAYDLFRAGYRVIDIGHIDMEYDMFLRHEKEPAPVRYKYSNEASARNPEPCLDPAYQREIIATIQ